MGLRLGLWALCYIAWSPHLLAKVPETPSRWSLALETETTFLNYEYFGPLAELMTGKTEFGTVIRATLGYRASGVISLQAGVSLLKRFDGNGIYKFYPLITLVIRAAKGLRILAGSIHPAHSFSYPLVRLGWEFEHPNADGVQLLFRHRHWHVDAHIQWQLYDEPSHPERFNLGLLARYLYAWFELSLQGRWLHDGGQLYPHLGVNIIDDRSAGLDVSAVVNRGRPVSLKFRVGGFFSYFRATEGDDRAPRLGAGLLSEAAFSLYGYRLSYEFWLANGHYFTRDGDPLYRAKFVHQIGLFKRFSFFGETVAIELRCNVVHARGEWATNQAIRFSLQLDNLLGR